MTSSIRVRSFVPVRNESNILLKNSFVCFGCRKPTGEIRPVICHHHHMVERIYFDMFQIPHTTFVPDYSRPIPHIKIQILKTQFEIYLS